MIIGSFSYSQTIAFATEMQDFKIATLVGEPTAGRANQTAQVQHWAMPNSGLKAMAPIYIMVRASGEESTAGVQPDLFIADHPTNDKATIETLLGQILASRNPSIASAGETAN